MISKIVLVMLVVVAIGSCFEMDSNDPVRSGCTSTPVDLVLLIDSSSSITTVEAGGSANMVKVKNFVKEYLTYYDISEQGTHVTIIDYDTIPRIIVNFGNHDMKIINTAIDSIKAGGNTYINLAMKKANEEIYTKEGGMRDSSVKRVLILFTDGVQSGDQEKFEGEVKSDATILKTEKNVEIYTVGVGNLDAKDQDRQKKFLNEVSSGKDYSFTAKDFSKLSNTVKYIVDKQCPPAPKPKPTPIVICNEQPVDLALLIDSSSSITAFPNKNEDMEIVKGFARNYLGYYNISEDGTHAAVIRYSDKAELIFNFGTYDENTINRKIDEIRSGGNTFMDKALDMADTQVFTKANGMRDKKRVKRVIILFTDGQQSRFGIYTEPKVVAQKLKDKGVFIYTVAVGSDLKAFNELNEIASAPAQDYTFFASSFDNLKSVVEKVINKQCKLPCPFDVALIIDSSNSINKDEWTDIVSFSKRIVDAFTFGPKDSRLALIRYNTHPKVMMKFDTFKRVQLNNQNIKHRLEQDLNEKYRYGRRQKPYVQGLTFIDRAFEMADKEVFTEQAGMRNGVKKICILMTDGMQTNYKAPYTPPHVAAIPLKKKGVEIFTVGMGGDIGVEEMVKTASSPDNCYSDETFYELEKKAKEMGKTTCNV